MARKKTNKELSEEMVVDIVSTLETTNDYDAVSKETGLTIEELTDLVEKNQQAVTNISASAGDIAKYARAIMKNASLAQIIESNRENYINTQGTILEKIQMAKTMAINALIEKLSDVSYLYATDITSILEKLVRIEETMKDNQVSHVGARFIPMSMRSISNTTITETVITVPSIEVKDKVKHKNQKQ